MNRTFGALLIWLVVVVVGCATGSRYGARGEVGYLRFEVEPAGAEVEIDEKYSGVADRWVQGVIPVEPGMRKVTLRADGYITQRFDIEVAAGEEVTLELHMEPMIELEPEQEDPHRQRLRAMSRENEDPRRRAGAAK